MLGDTKQAGAAPNSGLINFDAAAWANIANAQLQQALAQGLGYSEKYTNQAANALNAYNNQARQDQIQGFQQAQALNAPQRQASYNALAAYTDLLGLPHQQMAPQTMSAQPQQLPQGLLSNIGGQ